MINNQLITHQRICDHCEERPATMRLLDDTYLELLPPEADEWVCEDCFDRAVDRHIER